MNLDRPNPSPTPTPAPADDEALALGGRLRALRKERGLTLSQMSAETGLSAAFISQAERGLCRVSIPSLGRLAQALDVEAYTLILPERAQADRVEISRRRERPGYVQADDAPSSLASPLTGAGHQVRVVEVSGGPLQRTGPFRHLNDEFLYVIEGSVEIDSTAPSRCSRPATPCCSPAGSSSGSTSCRARPATWCAWSPTA